MAGYRRPIRQQEGSQEVSDWEAHQAAINNATDAMGGVQEAISMATERCDTAIGAILSATGASQVDSARNAMSYMQEVKNRLEEIFRITQQAVEEAQRYGRGF